MRIAFVDYVGDPARPGETGLSDLVWDMAGRLARLGDDVHVVAPYSVDVTVDSAVHVHRFPLPPIAYRNIVGHVLIVLAAYRQLKALGRVDLVHVPEYLSAAILATLMPRTPVVLTEPGNIFERIANGNPYDRMTTEVFKIAARRAAAKCARLVATSDEMAQWWQQTGFSPDRICRLPLGIDTTLFHRIANARASLGIAPETKMLLCAARLSRENGTELALEAVAGLAHLGQLQLHIVGSGPEEERLKRLSRSLALENIVVWHGWVDFARLPAFYSAADVFIFPGRSGGTPRVLLQAMACGAPVIASAIGGIVDHIENDKDGLLFPSGSSEGLRSAIVRLLADPQAAARLGAAGELYARSQVDWDVLVPRLKHTVYEPLMVERSGAGVETDHRG